jgi:hypothetical protein
VDRLFCKIRELCFLSKYSTSNKSFYSFALSFLFVSSIGKIFYFSPFIIKKIICRRQPKKAYLYTVLSTVQIRPYDIAKKVYVQIRPFGLKP